MMLRQFRSLALPAMALLVLNACASIETRGLPKCSGNERRPLNADLWGWESEAPVNGESVVVISPYAPIPQPKPEGIKAIEAMGSGDKPQWNVAASEEPCV